MSRHDIRIDATRHPPAKEPISISDEASGVQQLLFSAASLEQLGQWYVTGETYREVEQQASAGTTSTSDNLSPVPMAGTTKLAVHTRNGSLQTSKQCLARNGIVGRHPRWARDSCRIAIPPRIRQTTLKLTAMLRVPQFPWGTRSLCGENSGRLHPEGAASPVTPHPHFPNHFPINHLQLISPPCSLSFWSPP